MPVHMRKGLCFTLAGAVVLLGGATSAAIAAEAAPGTMRVATQWKIGDVPEGTEALDELEEVMVLGKRAAIMIADLEDDYYKRYNKLNKDNKYDVNCAYINVDPDKPGSALRTRVCMPVFVADAMQEWAQGRCEIPDFTSLDLNKDHVLSESEAAGNRQLLEQLYEMDTNYDRRITFVEFLERPETFPTACYSPPPPEQVLMAGTDKWYAQMMKVTSSDPLLLQMAANLGDLYGQLRVLEKQAGKLEAREKAETYAKYKR